MKKTIVIGAAAITFLGSCKKEFTCTCTTTVGNVATKTTKHTTDKTSKKDAELRAHELLELLNLKDRASHKPSELSGGEQQRIAVARALINNPKVIFADEPTANLDTESSKMILDIFSDLHAKGQTIVMVTHEEEYSRAADRVIVMKDGIIEEQRVKE
jgi:ABC-type lipoprotein export system ATPase subunit